MFPNATMLHSLFWMIFGALQILVILGIIAWAKHFGTRLKYWQTAIIYGLFATICLTIGGGFTLAGEYESQAGWYFIGFLGVPQLLALIIAVKFFMFPKKA